MSDERFFEDLAAESPVGAPEKAPASMKARLYTALIRAAQQSGPLAPLGETKAAGRGLCVFEELVQISPVSGQFQRTFYCSVCHARILAERFDDPPIWWPNCPYSDFKNG